MQNPQKKSIDTSPYFKFGPLAGRSDFYYEHVPLCPEDPICFRSTCGYCHPCRDSQSTHWSWVYPLNPSSQPSLSDTKRSAVSPFLFGNHFTEDVDPSSLSRECSVPEDVPLNFDFLDSHIDVPPNPWDITGADFTNGVDGPSLRKMSPEKPKVRNRIQSSLRTNATPFVPTSSLKNTLFESSTSQEKLSVKKFPENLSNEATTMEPVKADDPKAVEQKVLEIESKIIEPTKGNIESSEKKSSIVKSKPKTKGKIKTLPVVPPYKLKTHTRKEQESLAPLLPLRGGSSNSSSSSSLITEMPKAVTIPSSLPLVRNLTDGDDFYDSSQILDTGAKAPVHIAWFMVLWNYISAWLFEFSNDVKELLVLVWASILLRLPYFASKAKNSSSRTHLKKPTKPFKTSLPLTKSEISRGKMRK